MRIHEFGNREHPVILFLPGTMCYWKGNFGEVIENLARDFNVAAAAYTGFDEADTENYVFYATKMGEKYLERYRKYFRDPVIHEQNLRHEELPGVYPEEWCKLVRKICL